MENTYKYSLLDFGTKIFFMGDKIKPMGFGKIGGELSTGLYVIHMDCGDTHLVHPEKFEGFRPLFQVEDERKNKASYYCQN